VLATFRLTIPLAAFHYVEGGGNPLDECKRLNALIRKYPIDVVSEPLSACLLAIDMQASVNPSAQSLLYVHASVSEPLSACLLVMYMQACLS
jgi:hypothetical protein